MPSKNNEYRGMSDEQLSLALKDTEKHLFQLRFQSATDRLETPSEIQKARREIARIRTVQRLRDLDKLRALPVDQLAARIESLTPKSEAGPGKRMYHRQLKRVTALHAAKAPPAKPTKKNRPAGGSKGATMKPKAAGGVK